MLKTRRTTVDDRERERERCNVTTTSRKAQLQARQSNSLVMRVGVVGVDLDGPIEAVDCLLLFEVVLQDAALKQLKHTFN